MGITTVANGRAAEAEATTSHEQQPEPELLGRVVEATQAQRHSMEEVRYMADAASKSGMFGMTQAQAFVLMQLCQAEGLHPIQAVRRYDIIDGKPAMKAAAMQAEFQRRGGRIRWKERTAEACEAEFSHPVLQPEPLSIRWSLRELKDSGVAIAKDGKIKKNYRTFPRAMLHARVISEAVRAIDPAIVVGLYTPEELSDFDELRTSAGAPAPAVRKIPLAADPHSEPIPPQSWREYVQARIDAINAELAFACLDGKKPQVVLSDPKGRPVNVHQVLFHLIKQWIEQEAITKACVNTDDGRGRDRAKCHAVADEAWAQHPDDFRWEVDGYLAVLKSQTLARAGLSSTPETEAQREPVPAEEIDQSDPDEASGEWETGRE